MARRTRDLRRESAREPERDLRSGQGARDQVHLLRAHRPPPRIRPIVQWRTGIRSRLRLPECAHLRNLFWARGSVAVASGPRTEARITHSIAAQDGGPGPNDRRCRIADRPNLPPSRRSVFSLHLRDGWKPLAFTRLRPERRWVAHTHPPRKNQIRNASPVRRAGPCRIQVLLPERAAE